MKRLIVLRHAKSDWNAEYGSDHDRPLNRRGVTAARTVGSVLTRWSEQPDVAITSSAVRARTTLELAAEAGGWETRVRTSPDLYGTSAQGALAVASGTPPTVERLMLVGHQPAWGSLVMVLTGGAVEMKTATAVAIDVLAGSWADLTKARGSIAYILQPRLFTDGDWPQLGWRPSG